MILSFWLLYFQGDKSELEDVIEYSSPIPAFAESIKASSLPDFERIDLVRSITFLSKGRILSVSELTQSRASVPSIISDIASIYGKSMPEKAFDSVFRDR